MKLAVVTKYEHNLQIPDDAVYFFLSQLSQSHELYFGPQTSATLDACRRHGLVVANRTDGLRRLAEHVDAVVVIGGDGTMLGAAREVAGLNKGMIGINRGRVGFITDIPWTDYALHEVQSILNGQRIEDVRTLLDINGNRALNDVLVQRNGGHMLEFDVYINQRFAYRSRSDGLLVSTPTGSTAYNLSAGGAIVMPTAKVFTVAPIMPQTLSNRPLILDDTATIQLELVAGEAHVYADGIELQRLLPTETISIQKSKDTALFWHPVQTYNHLETLRTKLGWNQQMNP